MRVVITGGAGFLGTVLTRRLVERPCPDRSFGPSGADRQHRPVRRRRRAEPGDRTPGSTPSSGTSLISGSFGTLIDRDDVSVFHLASMVSAGCELDFDRALAVNLDGTRAVLEACRARVSTPRLVFSSSIVAFGGVAVEEIVSDRPS